MQAAGASALPTYMYTCSVCRKEFSTYGLGVRHLSQFAGKAPPCVGAIIQTVVPVPPDPGAHRQQAVAFNLWWPDGGGRDPFSWQAADFQAYAQFIVGVTLDPDGKTPPFYGQRPRPWDDGVYAACKGRTVQPIGLEEWPLKEWPRALLWEMARRGEYGPWITAVVQKAMAQSVGDGVVAPSRFRDILRSDFVQDYIRRSVMLAECEAPATEDAARELQLNWGENVHVALPVRCMASTFICTRTEAQLLLFMESELLCRDACDRLLTLINDIPAVAASGDMNVKSYRALRLRAGHAETDSPHTGFGGASFNPGSGRDGDREYPFKVSPGGLVQVEMASEADGDGEQSISFGYRDVLEALKQSMANPRLPASAVDLGDQPALWGMRECGTVQEEVLGRVTTSLWYQSVAALNAGKVLAPISIPSDGMRVRTHEGMHPAYLVNLALGPDYRSQPANVVLLGHIPSVDPTAPGCLYDLAPSAGGDTLNKTRQREMAAARKGEVLRRCIDILVQSALRASGKGPHGAVDHGVIMPVGPPGFEKWYMFLPFIFAMPNDHVEATSLAGTPGILWCTRCRSLLCTHQPPAPDHLALSGTGSGELDYLNALPCLPFHWVPSRGCDGPRFIPAPKDNAEVKQMIFRAQTTGKYPGMASRLPAGLVGDAEAAKRWTEEQTGLFDQGSRWPKSWTIWRHCARQMGVLPTINPLRSEAWLDYFDILSVADPMHMNELGIEKMLLGHGLRYLLDSCPNHCPKAAAMVLDVVRDRLIVLGRSATCGAAVCMRLVGELDAWYTDYRDNVRREQAAASKEDDPDRVAGEMPPAVVIGRKGPPFKFTLTAEHMSWMTQLLPMIFGGVFDKLKRDLEAQCAQGAHGGGGKGCVYWIGEDHGGEQGSLDALDSARQVLGHCSVQEARLSALVETWLNWKEVVGAPWFTQRQIAWAHEQAKEIIEQLWRVLGLATPKTHNVMHVTEKMLLLGCAQNYDMNGAEHKHAQIKHTVTSKSNGQYGWEFSVLRHETDKMEHVSLAAAKEVGGADSESSSDDSVSGGWGVAGNRRLPVLGDAMKRSTTTMGAFPGHDFASLQEGKIITTSTCPLPSPTVRAYTTNLSTLCQPVPGSWEARMCQETCRAVEVLPRLLLRHFSRWYSTGVWACLKQAATVPVAGVDQHRVALWLQDTIMRPMDRKQNSGASSFNIIIRSFLRVHQPKVCHSKFTVRARPHVLNKPGKLVLVKPDSGGGNHGGGGSFNISKQADWRRVEHARVLMVFEVNLNANPPSRRDTSIHVLVLIELFGRWDCAATAPAGYPTATQLYSGKGAGPLGASSSALSMLKVVPAADILGPFDAVPNLDYPRIPSSQSDRCVGKLACCADFEERDGCRLWVVHARATKLTRGKRPECAALAALWQPPSSLVTAARPGIVVGHAASRRCNLFHPM